MNYIKNQSEGLVLVVDDQDCFRRLLKEILTLNGFDVALASDGRSAIEIAKKVIPDLILLDVCMPGIDGYETYNRLKEIKETKDISVIFVSAQNDQMSQIKGLELGSLDYIEKPLNYLTLLQKVRTHVKQRKVFMELIKLEKALLKQNEQERKKIEYEMHEDLCQSLAAINMLIDKADKTDIKRVFYQTLNKALGLAHEMYPISMQMGNGIISALKELSVGIREIGNISCNFACLRNSIPDHFTDTALHVYRIAQRTIRNAVIHSNAQNITIYISKDNNNVLIKIEYDGLVFNQISNYNDLELEIEIMKHLASIFDSTYTIISNKEKKTVVTLSVPLDALSEKQIPVD